jgi:hypothetical protein
MKNLDFKVTREFNQAINDSPIEPNETVTIELPDAETLNVVVKMLHSNNLKATAYNVKQRICAFLERHYSKGWICTSLFHVPQFPNEPQPEVTVIYVNQQQPGHDNQGPQPDPPPV